MRVNALTMLLKVMCCGMQYGPKLLHIHSYPTELREETYYPWYFDVARPSILNVSSGPHAHGTTFDVIVATTTVGGGN